MGAKKYVRKKANCEDMKKPMALCVHTRWCTLGSPCCKLRLSCLPPLAGREPAAGCVA